MKTLLYLLFFGPLSPFEEELSFALFPVAKTKLSSVLAAGGCQAIKYSG